MSLTFGSVCSGIESASVAWEPLGMRALWYAEIDAFPSAVLAHHYPDVPNHGDLSTLHLPHRRPAAVDVLVGGTPCQSFSVAGLRGGLADPRGNLALAFVALVDALRPRWVVWENVPGVLSSGGGRDFGAFLGGLGECRYGWAYRVLDAQYFGLAQRRKRVFVVASSRGWRAAAAVLFEPESLRRDSPPRRSPRAGVAGTVGAGPSGSRGWRVGADEAAAGHIVAALSVDDGPRGGGQHPAVSVDLQNTRLGGDLAGTLDTGRPCRGGGQAIMAVSYAAGDTGSVMANGKAAASATSQDAHNGHLVAYGGNNTTGPIDVATAVRAKGGSGHGDFESETFIAIAIPIDIRNATREDARTGLGTSGTGIGNDGDPMHTIGTAQVQGVATAVRARAGSRGVDSDCPDTLIPTLAQPLRANGHDASEDGAGRTTLIPFVHAFDARQADVIQYGDLAGPLDTDSFTLGVDHPQRAAEPFTFDTTQITSVTNRSTPTPGLCHTLAKGAHAPGDAGGVMKVRRLTPREMERLQGFPDGYTLIPREKAQRLEADMLAYYRRQLPHATEAELRQLAADGPRAKALGNSMACNVMAWLGRRLLLVDAILNDPLADWHDAP